MLAHNVKVQLINIFNSFQRGMEPQANALIAQLLQQYPDNTEIYKELSIILLKLNKLKFSQVMAKKVFELEKSPENLLVLADVNFANKDYEDAAIQYEELTKHMDNKDFYFRSAHSYDQLDYYDEEIKILKKGYKKYKSVDFLEALISAYISAGRVEDAKKSVKILEENYSDSTRKYHVLAFFNEVILNDYEKAKGYYLKAAKNGDLSAYYNIGSCCKNNEDYDEAIKYLQKLASFKDKKIIDYNYTLGSIYMAQRKLKQGYKYYIKRDTAQNINQNVLHWDGKEYPNETICVVREQGFGDNIQFIRYLPLIAKKFKKLVYLTDDILLDLFKRSYPKEKYPNIEIRDVRDNDIKYDKISLIVDAPYLLNMTYYNIPSEQSYLVADEEKTEYFKEKYFNNDKLKIGLNWRSKGMGIRDAMYRTIDAPYYLKPLFDIPNTQYYSFQFGDIFDMCKKFPQIIDLKDELKTFDYSAAAMKNLDLLITVDSATAHLAGALGVKTYLLLCKGPDWRWFDNHEKTEWYPSVKIFRQKNRKNWDDVAQKLIETVIKDAKKFDKKKIKN